MKKKNNPTNTKTNNKKRGAIKRKTVSKKRHSSRYFKCSQLFKKKIKIHAFIKNRILQIIAEFDTKIFI